MTFSSITASIEYSYMVPFPCSSLYLERLFIPNLTLHIIPYCLVIVTVVLPFSNGTLLKVFVVTSGLYYVLQFVSFSS